MVVRLMGVIAQPKTLSKARGVGLEPEDLVVTTEEVRLERDLSHDGSRLETRCMVVVIVGW